MGKIVNNNGVAGFPFDIPNKSGLYYNKKFEKKSIQYIKNYEKAENYCYMYYFANELYDYDDIIDKINESGVTCVFESKKKLNLVMEKELSAKELKEFETKYGVTLSPNVE